MACKIRPEKTTYVAMRVVFGVKMRIHVANRQPESRAKAHFRTNIL